MVFDLVSDKVLECIFFVGCFDWEIIGLLLLINDGDFVKKLAYFSYEIKKFYQVIFDKNVILEYIEVI